MLEFQAMPVLFNDGLNTKLDPKLVPVGQVLTLENAEYGKVGSLAKRTGYDTKLNDVASAPSITSITPEHLIEDDNSLLAIGKRGTNNIKRYIAHNNIWESEPTTKTKVPCDISGFQVFSASYDQTDSRCDHYIPGNFTVYTWRDSKSTYDVHLGILDRYTNQFKDVIVAQSGTSTGMQKVNVITSVTGAIRILVFWKESTNCHLTIFDESGTQLSTSSIDIATTG
jgi:hypothetical protein